MARQTVRIGSREIAVEQAPLKVTLRGVHNKFTLSLPDDGELRLLPGRVVRAMGWIFCVLGWPVLLVGLIGILHGGLCLLVWGVPFAFFGVALLGPRYRFDRRSGELTIRHFGRSRQRPLADIVAVQAIHAGWFGTKYESDSSSPRFVSYQLNLILDDPSEPRLFVAYNADEADMGKKAKLLADFINVPLLAGKEIAATIRDESKHDVDAARVAHVNQSGSMRSLRDSQLPEPFRSWIERERPVPAQVRLLPRTMEVFFELGMFVILGVMFFGMDVLMIVIFGPVFARGDWGGILALAGVCSLLAIVPLYLLRRLFITIGASRDRKYGTLRQGVFVGREGVLVRMEPNGCYPIAADRFVQARQRRNGRYVDFHIDTLDGAVAFPLERLSVPPEHLNHCVEVLRKTGSLPPPTAEDDAGAQTPAPPVGEPEDADPSRHWAPSEEPMPPFDMASGALGGLRLGGRLEQAEFLGRPDRDEQTAAPRWFTLDYASRGFQLVFETGQFMELNCAIARPADTPREPGQGFCRPRLSGGIELTPETSVADIRRTFGAPESEENYPRGRALTYRQGTFTMEFEFEKATDKLLDWSVMALDD